MIFHSDSEKAVKFDLGMIGKQIQKNPLKEDLLLIENKIACNVCTLLKQIEMLCKILRFLINNIADWVLISCALV